MSLENEKRVIQAWKDKTTGIATTINSWGPAALINYWNACLLLIKEQKNVTDAHDYATILKIIGINRYGQLPKEALSKGLHGAVMGNHEEFVKYLINRDVDINQLDEEGNPPLFYVKNTSMLEILYSNKANFTLKNKAGTSFTEFTPRTDDLAAAFNKKITETATELKQELRAPWPNRERIIDCIQRGADVNTLSGGWSALHAVTASNTIKYLRTILSFPGIDLNKTSGGRSALAFANSLDVCMLLIEKGVRGTDFTLKPITVWQGIIDSLKSKTDTQTKQNLLRYAKEMLNTFAPDKLEVNAVDSKGHKYNMGHIAAAEKDVLLMRELLIHGLKP